MAARRLIPSVVAILLLLGSVFSAVAFGSIIHVAVASNFAAAARTLGERFEAESGHKMVVVPGSTGKHFAQIKNGAPFHLFLAADAQRPALLEEEGVGVEGSRFTYAIGRLVLWSPEPDRLGGGVEVLKEVRFRNLAIANPKLAPYGRAAQQVLEKLEIWTALQSRLVRGENIGHTFHFVVSGNAELGLVALSQTSQAGSSVLEGSRWVVPEKLYDPIEQQALLLEDTPPARSLVEFLRTDRGRAIIESFGYKVP